MATLEEIEDETADEYIVAIDVKIGPGKWYRGNYWVPKVVIDLSLIHI